MERKVWIDLLKGFCMLAILYFHTEYYYAGCNITPYSFFIGNSLAIFFFLSGYLFLSSITIHVKKKLLSIFRKLIVPYFIFMTLMVVPKAVVHSVSEELPNMFLAILTGEASWFVTALIVSQIFFTVTLSITKGKTLSLSILAVITLMLSAVFGNRNSPWLNTYNFWHINEALLAYFLLSLGYLYHRYEESFQRFNNLNTIILLFAITVLLKYVILHNDLQIVVGPIIVSNYLLFILDLLAVTALLISIFKRLPSCYPIQWTGEHSLVYYFICGGVPLLTTLSLKYLGFAWKGYHSTLLAFLLVYIISSAITYIIYRWLPFMVGNSRK